MPNRYTRDQLIRSGLQMAQLPNLEIHDMPDGVVLPDAFSITWLQDIIDWWYHMVPFSTTIVTAPLNATANVSTITLPADFIVDVRNGYLTQRIPGDVKSLRRSARLSYQKFINREITHQKVTNALFPIYYCVNGITKVDNTPHQILNMCPTPSISTVGFLRYYALPARLNGDDIPLFPASRIMTEYIRIRACEYMHVYDPGTAEKYCDKLLLGVKASGLLNEPEDDEIPFDEQVHIKASDRSTYSYQWMGPV